MHSVSISQLCLSWKYKQLTNWSREKRREIFLNLFLKLFDLIAQSTIVSKHINKRYNSYLV